MYFAFLDAKHLLVNYFPSFDFERTQETRRLHYHRVLRFDLFLDISGTAKKSNKPLILIQHL
jgi:hypothetical protein